MHHLIFLPNNVLKLKNVYYFISEKKFQRHGWELNL